MRRISLKILTLMLLATVAWSYLTMPVLREKSVRIEFDWNKQSGFSHVRSVEGLGRLLDPPYDLYFTNPIVTAQSKPLILSLVKRAESANGRNYTIVKGQVDVWVCCLGFVRGWTT
jgi:hypothetical protein